MPTFKATGSRWGLRDHRGGFILVESNVINGRLNIIEGEAIAMKEAITKVI
jgi:hypothetical protein